MRLQSRAFHRCWWPLPPKGLTSLLETEGVTYRHATAAQCGKTAAYSSALQSVVVNCSSPGMESGASCMLGNGLALSSTLFTFYFETRSYRAVQVGFKLTL